MPSVSLNLSFDLIAALDMRAEAESRSRSNLAELLLVRALGEGPAVGHLAVSGDAPRKQGDPERADPSPNARG